MDTVFVGLQCYADEEGHVFKHVRQVFASQDSGLEWVEGCSQCDTEWRELNEMEVNQ